MRFLLLATLLTVACRPESKLVSTAPAAVTEQAAADAGLDSPDVSAAVAMSGEPVAVSIPKTLHENGEFLVQHQEWEFDGTHGVAWLVRVPRQAPVSVTHSADVVPFAELLPSDAGPWAAINGGFYEAADTTYRPMGLVVTEGAVRNEITKRGGSGILFVDERGPHIVHRRAFSGTPSYALQSIDRIVDQGKSVVTQRPGQSHAMRSAVAISADHIWLVALAADVDVRETSDGAQLVKTGAGLPLWAFAAYVLDATGAIEALNLDGGISTQIAVRDGNYVLNVRGVHGTINSVTVRAPVASPPPTR